MSEGRRNQGARWQGRKEESLLWYYAQKATEKDSMREELERRIRDARRRLEGATLTEDEQTEIARREAIENFKVFLAQRIDLATRVELLLGASYFWLETCPAVRFELDDHVFILAQSNDGVCRLWKKALDKEETATLSADDPQFEDRLLTLLGSMLETGKHAASSTR